jgi:CheY-like chemotaxis protein
MSDLEGRRILLVEDEVLVALMATDMLEELGATVVGPAHRLPDGLDLASCETIDAAILDINLNDQRSDPIAARLVERGIPVIFASGYANSAAPAGFPLIGKPYSVCQLRQALKAALGSAA